ncbi:MAG: GNAT family N-acetyltransferase [Jatrophihabitantaceae bacterium]
MTIELRAAPAAELPAATLYRILQLRVAVFVVEQQCPYPELDGRDLEAGALCWWASSAGTVVATLRVLRDGPRTMRIGRVATDPAWRSKGVAARLLLAALDQIGPGPQVVLDAQSALAGWYARFGFVPAGEEFSEDGIAHLPMHRPAHTQPAPNAPG